MVVHQDSLWNWGMQQLGNGLLTLLLLFSTWQPTAADAMNVSSHVSQIMKAQACVGDHEETLSSVQTWCMLIQ